MDKTRLTYFIITRKMFGSPIWRDNPHVLKLFLYLIGMARHKKTPKRFPGFEIKRGEVVTSLSTIADDNEYLERKILKKWSRGKVSRMLHYLDLEEYIKILADTYGTHIRVLNYETYQSRLTYLADSSETVVKQVRNSSETGAGTYNKDNNVNNEKNVNKRKEAFSPPGGIELKNNGHEWVDVDSWNDFIEYRSEIKKPLSKRAVAIALNMLKENKDDQRKIIDNSILNHWTGIFPLKNKEDDGGWDKLRKEFCGDEKE